MEDFLYDPQADPHEKNNLLREPKLTSARLKTAMRKAVKTCRSSNRPLFGDKPVCRHDLNGDVGFWYQRGFGSEAEQNDGVKVLPVVCHDRTDGQQPSVSLRLEIDLKMRRTEHLNVFPHHTAVFPFQGLAKLLEGKVCIDHLTVYVADDAWRCVFGATPCCQQNQSQYGQAGRQRGSHDGGVLGMSFSTMVRFFNLFSAVSLG
jgi:hypothetical protein